MTQESLPTSTAKNKMANKREHLEACSRLCRQLGGRLAIISQDEFDGLFDQHAGWHRANTHLARNGVPVLQDRNGALSQIGSPSPAKSEFSTHRIRRGVSGEEQACANHPSQGQTRPLQRVR